MKESTLQSLITAKTLHERARELCSSENRNTATAGLIVLQDSLELIFLALLIEIGVDENQNIESFSFDQIIGALRTSGIKIPKTGTLKAMNKHRVLAKHYGELAEPTTVRNYLECSQLAIDEALIQVIGKKLHQIYLTDLLDAGESLVYLINASQHLDNNNYLLALLEIRKAIYIEFEYEYSIYSWKEHDANKAYPLFGLLSIDGRKAHYFTRNKEWISANVKSPTDYVQINNETLRVDLMEWGINTSEFDNLRRLTPNVFRESPDSGWHYKYGVHFDSNQANPENVQYCLDRAIAIILKKQVHKKANRYARVDKFSAILPFYLGDSVHQAASNQSEVVHIISNDFQYNFEDTLTGFDGSTYYKVSCTSKAASENGYPTWITGFLSIRVVPEPKQTQ